MMVLVAVPGLDSGSSEQTTIESIRIACAEICSRRNGGIGTKQKVTDTCYGWNDVVRGRLDAKTDHGRKGVKLTGVDLVTCMDLSLIPVGVVTVTASPMTSAVVRVDEKMASRAPLVFTTSAYLWYTLFLASDTDTARALLPVLRATETITV